MNRLEAIVYVCVFAVLVAGAWLAGADETTFREQLVVEDGPLEWMTVVGLLLLCGLCVGRALRLRHARAPLFIGMTLLYALVFFFGAGEEVSWGQRLLDIESSEFFRAHNAQGETNLHNLVVGDTKINKLIFAKGIGLAFLVYLFVVTPLYTRNGRVTALVDQFAVPIPHWRQVLAIVALLVIVEGLTESSKRGEMTEFGAPFLVLMIFLYPRNARLFQRAVVPTHGADPE